MSERESANKMEVGPRKYRERIQRESKFADDHKNLPFKFGKLPRSKPLNTYVACEDCNRGFFVTDDTILAECAQCKRLIRVKSIGKKGFFDE